MKSAWTCRIFSVTLGTVALLNQGCGSSAASGTLSVPTVATLVAKSLPEGLKPGGAAPVTPHTFRQLREQDRNNRRVTRVAGRRIVPDNSNGSLAAGYITNLFQNTFSGTQGYLMSQIATVDSRMSLFQGVATTGCLANTPTPYTLDLSAIDPMLNFTLRYLQCTAPFGTGATEGGEVFGQSGTTTSIWVQAGDSFSTTGGYINYANVENAGSTSASTPETVDGVSIAYGPNSSGTTGGSMTFTRYVAIPTNNSFEMFYGSSAGAILTASSTDTSLIGTGFRMISDGNYIYADGTLCNDPGGTTCKDNTSNWQAFNVCLDQATVLPHTPATDCTTLANSFTLNNTTASITFQTITGDSDVSHSYGYTGGTNPGPTLANVALVVPVGKTATFSSVTTQYP